VLSVRRNNAAKELVKERGSTSATRDFNLRIGSYLGVEIPWCWCRWCWPVALLYGVVHLWCEPPGNAAWQMFGWRRWRRPARRSGYSFGVRHRDESRGGVGARWSWIPQIIMAGVIAR